MWYEEGRREAQRRVAKGLAWLLESGPAHNLHVDDVNLEKLDLSDCKSCVLGQLGGEYNDVLFKIEEGGQWAREHGFEHEEPGIGHGQFKVSYTMLNWAWTEAITAERELKS